MDSQGYKRNKRDHDMSKNYSYDKYLIRMLTWKIERENYSRATRNPSCRGHDYASLDSMPSRTS